MFLGVQVMPRGSSIELAREMVEEVDRNGDGRVDYNEVRHCAAVQQQVLCMEQAT
jgi:calcium-dependent protein kinase